MVTLLPPLPPASISPGARPASEEVARSTEAAESADVDEVLVITVNQSEIASGPQIWSQNQPRPVWGVPVTARLKGSEKASAPLIWSQSQPLPLRLGVMPSEKLSEKASPPRIWSQIHPSPPAKVQLGCTH